jgi:class 3 adenylate cyclase/tetratricopeptide (TPR) repeat protein
VSVKHHRKIGRVIRCQNCGQVNPQGFRFCGACGAELAAAEPPRELRKTVTVLFCDVAGSTAMGERLDPESTRRVMARYFDEMRTAVERHGGTVEKFIGDAVMAVFGVPVVHEDDALRAVRAAADMRTALARLNDALERDWGVRIESRIGVNTGEVVAGEGDSVATGDAVNVAARLEQGAAPGETLVGEATYRLVRDAVEAQPVEPLTAKGKAEPVPAFRLVRVVEGAEFISRRFDSALVGRENELSQLLRAFDHAVSERVAYLFTLLGPAGIGKSRLVRELHERVDAALLSGRCLPYGEGITYWPLLEIEPLASELDFAANRDEIALQARRTLERLARERPLVVVFDDLQWAEPTFLDLVDHVTDLSRDAPMLVVCVARPELLDARRGWSGGKLNATTMLLEALTVTESEQLVDNLLRAGLDAETKARITTAAQGNPLYVEEMLAMVTENGSAQLATPPTIQALLAARLDRLPAEERTVVEYAAVQGEEFEYGVLAALLPDKAASGLSETLQSLVRKDLIRPGTEETFTFKHLLLRDAAYEALPKEKRAELHERFAERVEETHPEYRELTAYHLEQAIRYRSELGPIDEAGRDLARRASALLAEAGERAAARADAHATINLLERAIRLLPEGDPDAAALYPDLAAAIVDEGDLDRAEQLYRAAEELGDERTALRARLRQTWLGVMRGAPMRPALDPMEVVIGRADQLEDDRLVAEGLWRLSAVTMWLGDYATGEQLVRRSLAHAEAVSDARGWAEGLRWLGLVFLWGPTPVEQGLEECRELVRSRGLTQFALTELLVVQGALLAMKGDFEEGRRLAAEGRRMLLELGQKVDYAAITQPVALIELLDGNPEAAERLLREAHEILEAAGERGYLSSVSGLLALALAKQGRYAEAESFADKSRRLGAADDLTTQIYWRVAKAQAVAGKGNLAEATRIATEAAELVGDYSSFDGPMATVEIAPILAPRVAKDALHRAHAGATAKGNLVTAEQARKLLEALP